VVSSMVDSRTLLSAYSAVYSTASLYTVIFLAAFGLIVASLRAIGCGELIFGVRRGTWALKGVMLLHHGLVTPLAIVAIWEDKTIMGMFKCSAGVESARLMNRDAAPSHVSQMLVPVTLGYFTADLLLLRQWNLSRSGMVENLLMVFHHVASMVVWPATIHFDWVARYVIIMISYEFSSIFLTLNWMLSTAGMKSSPLYLLSGLLFTASFVAMRMLGAIPQFRAMWLSPPWSRAVVLDVAKEWIHDWCCFFSATLVLPHLLNLFWGIKVVRGFLAVATSKGRKPAGRKS